jgi:hypothetical protein
VLFDPAGDRYEPGDIASLFYLRPRVKTLELEIKACRGRDVSTPQEPVQLRLDGVESVWDVQTKKAK